MTFVEPQKLNSPELSSARKVLGSLILINCIFYGVLITTVLFSWSLEFASYSIIIVLGYNIFEALLFFGLQVFNWQCTLICRIMWIIHNFAYFVTFAVGASWYKDGFYNDENYEECWDMRNSSYDEDSWCKDVRSHPFVVVSFLIFFVTFCIEISILVTYSKFPKNHCQQNCCYNKISGISSEAEIE